MMGKGYDFLGTTILIENMITIIAKTPMGILPGISGCFLKDFCGMEPTEADPFFTAHLPIYHWGIISGR